MIDHIPTNKMAKVVKNLRIFIVFILLILESSTGFEPVWPALVNIFGSRLILTYPLPKTVPYIYGMRIPFHLLDLL